MASEMPADRDIYCLPFNRKELFECQPKTTGKARANKIVPEPEKYSGQGRFFCFIQKIIWPLHQPNGGEHIGFGTYPVGVDVRVCSEPVDEF